MNPLQLQLQSLFFLFFLFSLFSLSSQSPSLPLLLLQQESNHSRGMLSRRLPLAFLPSNYGKRLSSSGKLETMRRD